MESTDGRRPTGERFVADGRGDADATLVSHAHGDHYAGGSDGVASELTAALLGARRDDPAPTAVDHPAVELFPAGHVAGSRAMRLTDPETGRRYLYTGDCSTRDRFHLGGFDPVDADVLIVETTYGKPEYRFPSTAETVGAVRSWLASTTDRPAVLFGYALGRAQKLQRILAGGDRERVYTQHGFADEFATSVRSELGIPAQSLKRDQATLGDF